MLLSRDLVPFCKRVITTSELPFHFYPIIFFSRLFSQFNKVLFFYRSWYSILPWLLRQKYFDQFFVRSPDDGLSWTVSELSAPLNAAPEERIPYELLDSAEAATIFLNHCNVLRAEYRKAEYVERVYKTRLSILRR